MKAQYESRVISSHEAVEDLDEERHLRSILESPSFQKAPTIRALLLYLWQHRGESISEYAIAIDALGRRPDFDTKIDATVRVHIARLRQKLKEFYESDGKGCPLQISIPRGSHELEISLQREVPELAPIAAPPSVVPAAAPSWNKQMIALGAALAVMVAVCGGLIIQNRKLAATVHGQTVVPHRFWQSLVANGKPAKLFLPMPVFFEWNLTSVKLRDPTVNDFADLDHSPALKSLVARWGPPTLMQNYTTIGDTLAAFKLSSYLDKGGIPLSVATTTELTMDSVAESNVILIGTPWVTDRYSKQLQENFNFQYTEERSTDNYKFPIVNRNPRPNEQDRYETKTQSGVRRIAYGLITVLPSRGSNTRILSLRERPPSPLVSFLTGPASLELLDQAWRKEGSPEYFEAVVGAEFDGNNVLRTWPAAMRAINVQAASVAGAKH